MTLDDDAPPAPRRRDRSAARDALSEPVADRDALGEPVARPDLDAVGAAVDTSPPVTKASPPAIDTTPVPFAPPRLESASSDVVAASSSRIPGAARDGYHQLPTAPVITTASGPVEGETAEWEPPAASLAPAPRGQLAAWALGVAIVAIVASIFVGFLLPLGLIAIVVAIIALRRPVEPRAVAVWALVLGVVSVLYSAGWLVWALPQLS